MHRLTGLMPPLEQTHNEQPYFMGKLFEVTNDNMDEFHEYLKCDRIEFLCECGGLKTYPHVIRKNKWQEESQRRKVIELLEKIANNSSKSDNSLIYGITGLTIGLGLGGVYA